MPGIAESFSHLPRPSLRVAGTVGGVAIAVGVGLEIAHEIRSHHVDPLPAPLPAPPAWNGDGASYENPVVNHDAADPSVVHAADGNYYMYTTNTTYGGTAEHTPVLRSTDLVHWQHLGDALPKLPAFAGLVDTQVWAPHVSQRADGLFQMYSAVRAADHTAFSIVLSESRSPAGPFTPVEKPIISGTDTFTIDPYVLDDKDGKRYLYWGSGSRIMGQQMTPDGRGVVGAPSQVLAHDASKPYEHALVEGSWVVHHGDHYYLMYSGDQFEKRYAVSVARADSPLGPFTQRDPAGPMLRSNDGYSEPGHNAVATDAAGTDWLIYHEHLPSQGPGHGPREVAIDRIDWSSGWPRLNGGHGLSTGTRQQAPVTDASAGATAASPTAGGRGSRARA